MDAKPTSPTPHDAKRSQYPSRIGLVGAGFIASVHLEALRGMDRLRIGAVIDPNKRLAERLAERARVPAFATLADAIEAQALDRAHILVPPQHHKAVALECLSAGLPTFVEKPLSVTVQDATELAQIAKRNGVPLGVNHNFMFAPKLLRFAAELAGGRHGRLRHVSATCAVPLRQLAAKQFGHWMFERPSNIILEQLVHPLSQLWRLLGRLTVTAAVAKPPVELGPGLHFHRSFDVTFRNESGATAQLHMAFGEAYPASQFACLCDDGLVVVDGQNDVLRRQGRTRYLEQADRVLVGVAVGTSEVMQAGAGFAAYVASQLKLVRRADPFFRSMCSSVAAFHDAVDRGHDPLSDGDLGAHLVALCADIAAMAGVSGEPVARPPTLVLRGAKPPTRDVAVLGGTGFIGKATVEKLTAAGYSVSVMARGMRGLPKTFHAPNVSLVEGDVTNADDVARGIGEARFVVNLAHGGASGSREAIVDAMVGSANLVGRLCLDRQVRHLIHVSSIAALYLGDASQTIVPATPADTQGEARADYSFAKAEAERALLALHEREGLSVSIQRPGIVVGEGTSPFHSGVGLFNNEQHCIGWAGGRNPLPFVLVDDCADAVVEALKAHAKMAGRTDNIIGAVRMTAREYIAELAKALERPLKFHPGALWKMQAVEAAKWLVKKAGGAKLPFPSARDLRSRGLQARFDTTETEGVLSWHPTADRAVFVARGIVAPAQAQRAG